MSLSQSPTITPNEQTQTQVDSVRSLVVPTQYLLPFVLTTSCFVLWGFANDVTNPLVKVFKEVFLISNFESSLVQFAFYGGYFTMALPAALFIRRFSYKSAIMLGFALYAIGALLSIPASLYLSFSTFLIGFYILTFGLAFLETSCNPYILAMGPPETSTQRLNLAQAFNPVGSLTGMVVASMLIAPNLEIGHIRERLMANDPDLVALIPSDVYPDGIPSFSDELPGVLDSAVGVTLESMRQTRPEQFREVQGSDLAVVRTPYVVVAGVVIVMIVLFGVARMPTFSTGSSEPVRTLVSRLLKRPRYIEGVLAQAFYVGAQITCWTFIIHYGMEQVGLSLSQAQNWNIAAMVLFLTSRFICTFLLKYFSAGGLLASLSIAATFLTMGVIFLPAKAGLISLVTISGCMSLMFPTIYGIALKDLPESEAQLGSAGLVMAIVGGAVLPLLQGGLIDSAGVRSSFVLPAICFVFIAIYGLRCYLQEKKGISGAVVENGHSG